jgi:MFS transporter, CP family, cyanate transporter
MIATVVLWLFGKLVDINHGDFTASFILIAIISSSFFLGSFFLPETNVRQSKG